MQSIGGEGGGLYTFLTRATGRLYLHCGASLQIGFANGIYGSIRNSRSRIVNVAVGKILLEVRLPSGHLHMGAISNWLTSWVSLRALMHK